MFSSIINFLLPLSGWPLVAILVIGGLYFSVRSGFVQFRLFPESLRVVSEKPEQEGAISSFGALMISTASRVGTGNIVGVSTAICVGGPGAVIWMWFTALLGGASGFVESTLAQIYKKKNPDGSSYGGPSYYIEACLHSRVLGVIFALFLIFTYGVGYNMLASYNLQSAFNGFGFYTANPDVVKWVIGGAVSLLTLYCLLGGGKRIVKVTGTLVPVMGVFYVLVSLIVIIMNIKLLPQMFGMIFANAFDFQAIFGGFLGSCLMYGFKRGLFSNEAGIGSAPNAAAAADVSHPVKQGLVQMLSVYIDTLLLCTATALMCLCSGVAPSADLAGAPFVREVLTANFGAIGPIFLATAMFLFAFTTLVGNFFYIEGCFAYLLKKTPSKSFLTAVRVIGAVIIFVGAGISFGLAWDTADVAQAILAFINIPVCMILAGTAVKCLNNYLEQKKAGKNPVFKASDIGLDSDKLDFWK